MRKKVSLTYSKERVVLSDVLPYETPLTFSNKHFYNYLKKRRNYNLLLGSLRENLKNETNPTKQELINQKITTLKNNNKAFNEIEKILFREGAKAQKEVTKPFMFNICHKQDDFRELTIIHPFNQIKVSDFYEDYKDLILYYCSLSPFSIRKPKKVAKFVFYNDVLHKRSKNGDLEHSLIEEDNSEYESLKSYFTYYEYSNIHKFYESYRFHRCEKKYAKLLKIDISKCFDSIYTHTISWAVLNKSIIKQNIDASREIFAGQFDELMQKLNANETNGIVIGPEFSRIFAEIILQKIDKNIFDNLNSEKGECEKLIHKVDYEIFRYVDDCFIFFNEDKDAERILKEFRLSLKEYKMYLNDSKSIVYEKPIITEISIAKQKIADLFDEHLKLVINEQALINEKTDTDGLKPFFYFSSNNVITRFKTIIKESNIEYKDIMNYSLAVLNKKTEKLINKYKSLDLYTKENNESHFVKGFLQILDVTFFFYSVTPRVNFTIKLCLILDKIISFLKVNKSNNYKCPFLISNKHLILKKISDEISLTLHKNKSQIENQIENLYLLIALSQLGREYRLDSKVLCSYFNIEIKSDGELLFKNSLNYFSITVLLFYIKDITKYEKLKDELKKEIVKKLEKTINSNWKSNSEVVMLIMDLMVCPFLNIPMITREEKQIFESEVNAFHTLILARIENLNDYINNLQKKINDICALKFVEEKLSPKKIDKIKRNLNTYITELNSFRGFNVYLYEEKLVNSVLELLRYYSKEFDKYKFKKKMLTLLGIDNHINLIEQEKFWFTKWTEFDFGMELQAKRSQEVY